MELARVLADNSEFLLQYEGLWSREVLNEFPRSANNVPEDLISPLLDFAIEELWQMDQGDQLNKRFSKRHQELQKWTERLNGIASDFEDEAEFTRKQLFRIKEKKQHEIRRLVSFIRNENPKYVVDLCGGQGHFARCLAGTTGCRVESLDYDQALQDRGRRGLNSQDWHCDLQSLVSFQTIDLLRRGPGPIGADLSVGLHTCGALAIRHLDAFLKGLSAKVLNIGCCYLKLNPNTEVELFDHGNRLSWTQEALTLASRGTSVLTLKEFEFNFRVKQFRYALAKWLRDREGQESFLAVGEVSKRSYQGDFGSYAIDRLLNLGLASVKSRELNDFFATKETQEQIRWVSVASYLRWQWGRALEWQILLLRALYLQNAGKEPKFIKLFDPRLSPRNIAITA